MGKTHGYLRNGIAVLVAAMLPWFSTLYANTYPIDKLTGVINLYGVTLIFPAPSWVPKNSHDVRTLASSKLYRQQQGNTFIFEAIPKSQDFAHWRQIFAINAFHIGDKKVHINTLIQNTLRPFYSVCGKENVSITTVKKSQDSMTVQVVCQATPHAKAKNNYGPDVGEVALFHFLRQPKVLIKVYQEWRGRAFKFKDTGGWPVSQDTLKETKRRFSYIRTVKTP